MVRERVRWPIVEAMGTAYALYTVTGDRQYETRYQTWWDYCIKYLMDYENGSPGGRSWMRTIKSPRKSGTVNRIFITCCIASVIPRIPLAPGPGSGSCGGSAGY